MITIPTSELTGLIEDVLAFACPVKTDPFHGILIEWDADTETLHAAAYDVLSAGRTSWTPGEGREGDVDDDDDDASEVAGQFGSDDPSWRVFISLPDAKEIVKVFKLPAKRWWVPVAIKVNDTGSRLTIERTGDHGPTEALLSARTDPDTLLRFPDIEAREGVTRNRRQSPDGMVRFEASRLAAFGAVRYHGVLELTFGAEGDPVSARMGSRFAGFIFTAGTRPAVASVTSTTPRGIDIRYGAGLVTTRTALDVIGDGPIETPEESAAIVDRNLQDAGRTGLLDDAESVSHSVVSHG